MHDEAKEQCWLTTVDGQTLLFYKGIHYSIVRNTQCCTIHYQNAKDTDGLHQFQLAHNSRMGLEQCHTNSCANS